VPSDAGAAERTAGSETEPPTTTGRVAKIVLPGAAGLAAAAAAVIGRRSTGTEASEQEPSSASGDRPATASTDGPVDASSSTEGPGAAAADGAESAGAADAERADVTGARPVGAVSDVADGAPVDRVEGLAATAGLGRPDTAAAAGAPEPHRAPGRETADGSGSGGPGLGGAGSGAPVPARTASSAAESSAAVSSSAETTESGSATTTAVAAATGTAAVAAALRPDTARPVTARSDTTRSDRAGGVSPSSRPAIATGASIASLATGPAIERMSAGPAADAAAATPAPTRPDTDDALAGWADWADVDDSESNESRATTTTREPAPAFGASVAAPAGNESPTSAVNGAPGSATPGSAAPGPTPGSGEAAAGLAGAGVRSLFGGRADPASRAAEHAAVDLSLLRTLGFADPNPRPGAAPVVELGPPTPHVPMAPVPPLPEPDEPVPPATVRFRTAGRDGAPVAGATVRLLDDQGHDLATAAAGDDGRGELVAPRPGDYVVIATASGHQPAVTTVRAGDGGEATLVLASSAALAGVVRDAAGRPLGGANVVLVDEGEVVESTQSAATGDYRVGDLAPGAYTVAVTAAGHTASSATVTVEPGTTVTHDVALQPSTAAVDGQGG